MTIHKGLRDELLEALERVRQFRRIFEASPALEAARQLQASIAERMSAIRGTFEMSSATSEVARQLQASFASRFGAFETLRENFLMFGRKTEVALLPLRLSPHRTFKAMSDEVLHDQVKHLEERVRELEAQLKPAPP